MKRRGYLIEAIADSDNLRLAFWKAGRTKPLNQEIILFCTELNKNLQLLRSQILTGTVSTGNYYCFTIFDPKERKILAAPFQQRVLHHAIMNICHPEFERFQIFDSYASRLGKGTYAALNRAAYYTSKFTWFLKLDFRKYFDNINHTVLKSQLKRMFKDGQLLQILNQIIDSYESSPGFGVPIGNLTSQYFANHYLASADHYAKENLKAPAYVRYMDDIVFWHNDKKELKAIGESFKEFTESRLKLTLKPFCLNKCKAGLPFLSYLVYPACIKLAHRSKIRFIKKMRDYFDKLENGIWTQQQFQKHILPLIAFTQHARAKGFRQKVINKILAGNRKALTG